jgi:radical SAM protein with 4Fe4S-binding SPASM domain
MTQLDILLGNLCQQECPFCYCYGTPDGTHLSNDEIKSVHSFLESLGHDVYYITGETFINSDDEKLLSTGQNYLLTNGLRINEESISNIEEIIFSLHGFREAHEYLTNNPNSWDLIVNNLRRAREINDNVHVTCVTYSGNYSDISEFCDFLVNENVSKVNFLRIVPMGKARHMSPDSFLTEEQSEIWINSVLEQRERFSKDELIVGFGRGAGTGPNFYGGNIHRVLSGDQVTSSFPAKNCGYYCPSSAGEYRVVVHEKDSKFGIYPCFMMIEPEFRIGEIDLVKGSYREDPNPFAGIGEKLSGDCSTDNCEYQEKCFGGCRASAIGYHRARTGEVDLFASQHSCITKVIERGLK